MITTVQPSKVTAFLLPAFLLLFCMTDNCRSAEQNGRDVPHQVIGTVRVPAGTTEWGGFRVIDPLVPKLRKLPEDRIVWVECRYKGTSTQELDVLKGYFTAARVEKYLREHHRINRDIWISIVMDTGPVEKKPAVLISILAEDVAKLDKLPAKPFTPPQK